MCVHEDPLDVGDDRPDEQTPPQSTWKSKIVGESSLTSSDICGPLDMRREGERPRPVCLSSRRRPRRRAKGFPFYDCRCAVAMGDGGGGTIHSPRTDGRTSPSSSSWRRTDADGWAHASSPILSSSVIRVALFLSFGSDQSFPPQKPLVRSLVQLHLKGKRGGRSAVLGGSAATFP